MTLKEFKQAVSKLDDRLDGCDVIIRSSAIPHFACPIGEIEERLDAQERVVFVLVAIDDLMIGGMQQTINLKEKRK